MRRSMSQKAACSSAGAQAVTANPARLAKSAIAMATGLDPKMMIWDRGKTGSTKISIVPSLGHMFLAKRTPPCSSPDAWPCSSSKSGGCTETRRDFPSVSASLAALRTAVRAQPPPIHPSEIVPSGRMTAFAPALAAVAATVRTTVASANGSPAALRADMMPRMSDARSIKSYPGEIGLECRKAFEIVRGGKQIDIGQRCLHAARLRAVIAPANQRIEPDNPSAAPTQPPHFLTELLGCTGVIAVGHDHHGRARIDHAPRVPTIESGEALTNLRAAADAL